MRGRLVGLVLQMGRGWLAVLSACLFLTSAAPGARATDITVMTQNLYIGADTGPVLDAIGAFLTTHDPLDLAKYQSELNAAVNSVNANNFPTRANAIAQEINPAAPPLLIGLQEAYGLTLPQPLDYTQTLIAALQQKGLTYAVVDNGSHVGASFKDPLGSGVSATDHDVVLALQNVPGFTITNSGNQTFANNGASGPLPLLNGYVWVDASLNGSPFQFVSTHLDPTGVNNQLQIAEILASLTDAPALVVGDFNTTDISLMLAAGFIDTAAAIGVLGSTCCQDPDLSNTASALDSRIDYIFERNFSSILSVSLIGDTSFEDTPPLWPSDHAGLVADVSTVPLPAALPLFASGLAGLGWLSRRRRLKTTSSLPS